MKITKQRLKEIIAEEISEHQFGFPSLGLTLADVTPAAKDKPEEPEEEEDTPAPAPKEPKKPQRAPTDAEIAAYMARYGGDSYGENWTSVPSNQGSDIKKRPRRYQENKQMKITKEQLKQIIKEELEAVQQESSSSLRSNPYETIKFFQEYGLSSKDGKVFISYDRDDWKEIIYQIDGDLEYEPTDDGMMVTVPRGA